MQSLPLDSAGITPELADAIVKNRPYASTPELVRKRVLTKPQFNRVKAQILVK